MGATKARLSAAGLVFFQPKSVPTPMSEKIDEAERLDPRVVVGRADGDLLVPESASLIIGNVVATRTKNMKPRSAQLLRRNVNSRETIDSSAGRCES